MSTTSNSAARQRIDQLLDENSFVEIGALVSARATDFNLKQNDAPSDGVITGYGVIDGNLVYVYSQDATVLNGSVGEMHAKKIAGLYDLAMKTGAPVIGLLDSTGLRLQEATDALNAFGEIYKKASLASGVIPQITAVFGTCGGGLAVMAGLSDFTFMESEKAKLFVSAPNTLDGNTTAKCDTASAAFQSEEAGNVDFTGTEAEVLAGIRDLVSYLPGNNMEDAEEIDCADDINRVASDLAACASDSAAIISRIADNYAFVEVKKAYAQDMKVGFIRLNGMSVGVVANSDAALSAAGCQKAADFVNFCDAFNIPVLTITNTNGYKACCTCNEKKMAGSVARMIYAFANATVAKVNVIVGKAFGTAYVAMNSKAIGADYTLAWSDAEVGCMDANVAAKLMYEGKGADVIAEKAKEYAALQNNVKSAAARGYVDTIIDAQDTRKYVIAAFELLYTKREDRPDKKHGTI